VYAAKQHNVVLIIVGHINKDGKIAGPKVLEHIVDCVLQFEGQKDNEFRVLRSIKNRFGPTGETGIFVMGSNGLQDLSEDDSLFSSTTEKSEKGVAKTLVIEGSRPLVLDIQALSSKTVFAYPKRVADGTSLSNLQVISAILQQHKVNMTESDIYIKTSAGYSIKNYSYADLGIITALVSSANNLPISQSLIFVGETTLNGTFHVPKSFEGHINEISRLFPQSTLVGPMSAKKNKVVTVRNINDLLSFLKSRSSK
jgi:DNA repair protein RadA/Sms